jgi:truncated hemoglobin YjbI
LDIPVEWEAASLSAAYQRYQELQRYVNWTEQDASRVREIGGLVAPFFAPLVEDFYAEIEHHPEARQVLTGGEQQIARLKQSLTRWLEELFSGRYDQEYVERRWRVGQRHVEIGLNQVFTNAALSRLRRGLLALTEKVCKGGIEERLAGRESLNTLLDLDLAII